MSQKDETAATQLRSPISDVHLLPPQFPKPVDRSNREVHENTDVNFHSLMKILSRRRSWIFGWTLAMLALAALVCAVMPRQYAAESKLELLKEDTSYLSVGSDVAEQRSDPLDFNISLQTQLEVLKSDTLAWQVMKQLKLVNAEDLPPEPLVPSATPFVTAPDQSPAQSNQNQDSSIDFAPRPSVAKLLKSFKKNLTVSSVAGTRLITVSYLDPDPKQAARIVNQLVSDFVEYTFQVRYNATTKATGLLQQQLVDLKSRVEKSQESAAQLQKESGIFGEDEHHNIVLTRLEQLNNELTSSEEERIIKGAVYDAARAGKPETVADLLGNQPGRPGGNAAVVLDDLRQQETRLQAEYADAATKYGVAYPKLIQIRERLDSIHSSIAKALHRISEQAQSEYQLAASRESAARKAFAGQKAIAAEMNNKAIDYLIAKQEADSNRALYNHLLEKLNEAGVEAGLRSSNLHVVDPAQVPVRPARPNIPLYLALGAFSGLTLGLVCAFLVDASDRTMRDVEEIETSAYVPVLGAIPQSEQRWKTTFAAWPKPLIDGEIDNPSEAFLGEQLHNPRIAEAFRAVRTSLLLSGHTQPANVIMVTSGMGQEGKTFSSLNLAFSLASKGKVLLVDADLRRRMLSRLLNQGTKSGLSQALSGEANVEAVYQAVKGIPTLRFLPAGSCAAGHTELLESERMTSIIDTWRRQFDYVVIDTPPVLPVTDAVSLSPKVDAVVVVIRFAVTSRENMTRTLRILRGVQAPRLRILINAANVVPEYTPYTRSYDHQQRD